MCSKVERSGRLPLPVRTLYTGWDGGRSKEGGYDGEFGPEPGGEEYD